MSATAASSGAARSISAAAIRRLSRAGPASAWVGEVVVAIGSGIGRAVPMILSPVAEPGHTTAATMGNMGPPMQRMAVIDMGSNSFRLVVFEYEPTGWWSLIDEIREPTRVSAGMGESGALQPKPMKRAVQTAIVFANFLRASGVERVEAVATSAIRDASNRDELLAEIRDRTGLEVRVISGAEEAWYGYLAIANSTTVGDGFGIDIGGGSVQIMQLQGRRLLEAESVRLGAVRVSEEFLPGRGGDARSRSRRCASTWRARCRSSSGSAAASRPAWPGWAGPSATWPPRPRSAWR